jgi:predicted DNA-binding protein
VVKDFVTYKVHIHKTNHEDLYRLLENMPKSTRGIYIREAIEHYARMNGLLAEKPKTQAMGISFQGTFDEDFGGTV